MSRGRWERDPERLKHRVEYLAFRLFRGLLTLLPAPLALGLGEVVGWKAGVILRMRRDVVDGNLARAFPEASRRWRDRVARAAYRHLGRESVATLRMASARPEDIEAAVEADPDQLRRLREDLDRGRGVVLVTGHLGNWEMGGAYLAALGIPVDAVVQVQRNRRFDADLRGVRERLGMTVMPKQDAPRGVLKALRRGRAAALVADQNVAVAGLFVDFFGIPAATARGPPLARCGHSHPPASPALQALPGEDPPGAHRGRGGGRGTPHPQAQRGAGGVDPADTRTVLLASQAVEDPSGHSGTDGSQ